MLPLPTGSHEASIVGIDPGTVNFGVATLTFDLTTFKPTRCEARTLDGERLPGSDWSELIHGARYRRVEALKAQLVKIFDADQPVFVCSESPFYSKRQPNAFGALTEVICAIREAVKLYSLWKPLLLVDPPRVKQAVGASGNAKKDGVLAALKKQTELMDALTCPIDDLDEHAIDAIAVAFYVLNKLKAGTLMDPPASR